jgi:hypothetical protein
MPGYNHKRSCQCGWCVKEKKEDDTYANFSYGYGISNNVVEVVKKHYKTPCWWCGELVYYHSNGHGDSVLFDEYAPPWPIHGCYQIHQQSKNERKAISNKFVGEDGHARYFHEDDEKSFIRELINSFANPPSEKEAADRLGLSISNLRRHYGHCYSVVGVSGEDWRELIRIALNKGADFEITIKINAQIASHGGDQKITFDIDEIDQNSVKVRKRRDLNIAIPAGITSAHRLRVHEHGYPSYTGGSPGDLYIRLDIVEENSAQ